MPWGSEHDEVDPQFLPRVFGGCVPGQFRKRHKSVAVPCRHSRDVKFADDAALNGSEPGAELTVDP